MNHDEKYLDAVLQEHARHQNQPDTNFLEELERKMNENKTPHPMKDKAAKRPFPILKTSIAAALTLGAGATAFHFLSPNEELVAANTKEDVEAPNPVAGETVDGKKIRTQLPAAPSSSMAKVISATTAQHNGVPVPVVENSPAGREAFFAYKLASRESRGEAYEIDLLQGHGGIYPQDLSEESHSSNKYGALTDQPFQSPLKSPLSTLSIDVDTASYTNIRRLISDRSLINRDAVRIEELINYFNYSYPQPTSQHPFAIHTEIASCPWNEEHRLVKVGIKGKEIKNDTRKAANLVFLIDVSGSMSSHDKLPLLVQSFETLLRQLNKNDRVSIVTYAGHDSIALKPTAVDEDGRTAIRNALKSLSSGGSTNGASGLKTAYQLASQNLLENGVNRVILATDGDFNVGPTSNDGLLSLIKTKADNHISLTVLGFGQGNLNDHMMEEISNKGDGNYYYIDSLREANKVLQHGITGTIETIAKDVKVQVEFNPGKVAQYRLIGYANRRLRPEDFKNDKVDAGDLGAGHTVTALYEIIPHGVTPTPKTPEKIDLKYQKPTEGAANPTPPADRSTKVAIVNSPETLTVKMRYKQPDGDTSTELSSPLTDNGQNWKSTTKDFQFASSVALWGMMLRNSKHIGNGNTKMILDLAESGIDKDPRGDRSSHLDLLQKWKQQRPALDQIKIKDSEPQRKSQ